MPGWSRGDLGAPPRVLSGASGSVQDRGDQSSDATNGQEGGADQLVAILVEFFFGSGEGALRRRIAAAAEGLGRWRRSGWLISAPLLAALAFRVLA